MSKGKRPIEDEIVASIVKQIEARNPDPYALDHLSIVEADLLGTVTAKGVVGNGGFHYWYQGKDQRDTEAVARSFGRLGLPEAAEAMRRSLDAFPNRTKPDDYFAFIRQREQGEQPGAPAQLWDALDNAIWDVPWDRAALLYILENAVALTEVVPGAGAALERLEHAWQLAATRLRTVLEDAAEIIDRDACRRCIAANDHHAAHAALVAAGPRPGRAVPFWAGLREVAEILGVADNDVSYWNHRFASEGFVAADVEVVFTNEHEVRILDSGPAKWNAGNAVRRLFGHRTDVFAYTNDDDYSSRYCIYDRGRIRLVPAHPIVPGTAIVVHRKGIVLARGKVVEVVSAEGD